MSIENTRMLFLPGVLKAATTSVFQLVGEHDKICRAKPKHTKYFMFEYEKGLSYYYQTYFHHHENEEILFDGTPNYIMFPGATERIQEIYPEAKFIVMLRDPVKRAHSQWWMNFSVSNYENLPFQQAIRKNIENEKPLEYYRDSKKFKTTFKRKYVEISKYSPQLRHLYSLYPEEQVKIFLVKDLKENTKRVIRDIWGFVNLPCDRTINTTVTRKSLDKIGSFIFRCCRGFSRLSGISNVISENLKSFVWNRIRIFTSKSREKPKISSDLELYLRDFYSEDINTLENLIERDLSHWKYQS